MTHTGKPAATESVADVFGAGCDARLAGLPDTANPHTEKVAAWHWKRGWDDVDRYYGKWAKWPIRALPEVRS